MCCTTGDIHHAEPPNNHLPRTYLSLTSRNRCLSAINQRTCWGKPNHPPPKASQPWHRREQSRIPAYAKNSLALNQATPSTLIACITSSIELHSPWYQLLHRGPALFIIQEGRAQDATTNIHLSSVSQLPSHTGLELYPVVQHLGEFCSVGMVAWEGSLLSYLRRLNLQVMFRQVDECIIKMSFFW